MIATDLHSPWSLLSIRQKRSNKLLLVVTMWVDSLGVTIYRGAEVVADWELDFKPWISQYDILDGMNVKAAFVNLERAIIDLDFHRVEEEMYRSSEWLEKYATRRGNSWSVKKLRTLLFDILDILTHEEVRYVSPSRASKTA